ncbi:UTP--glucose-1-phosphate uridylyltransferase [Amylibacter kogurei]|uniref:UTP--glucose-1-phosphate uridylyltransferase n=1 Tax=Paramylibacter kogurei TaxID=1889778 RepID=A0A2G5KB25_9RHOB|nr:UTP--glucose-1-phosphate uridylyltransferase GalU [Amylibacter kogurei]PIB26706.1 UTP--glucose-1-phosphate uridylyltransferase [Amylibacter kogurei]
MPKITKAVFPVAGMGTRFLPATKSIPKEILTLVDRPLIQYAIDEARDAGIEEFIFVTSRGKSALEDYFDAAPELENSLKSRGKWDLLEECYKSSMNCGEISYVRQTQPLGLGHAVLCARRIIGNEPFAVILPDDVIASEKPCIKEMMDAHEQTGGNIIAAMEVPMNRTNAYGILDVKHDDGKLISVKGLVEKPDVDKAPSNLAVIGRYILTPQILDHLAITREGAGNEIQLTDAIASELRERGNVYGFRFDGERFDCGSKAGFLQASISFGLSRDDLRDELMDYLVQMVETPRAAQ